MARVYFSPILGPRGWRGVCVDPTSQGLSSGWGADVYPGSLGGRLCQSGKNGVPWGCSASEGWWSWPDGQAGFP